MWKIVIALVLGIVLIGSCESKKEPIKPEFVRTKVTISKVTYRNLTEVSDAYNNYVGLKHADDYIRYGWATWSASEPYTCEIHSVDPRFVEDKVSMETWGHEYMHCVYGNYHED